MWHAWRLLRAVELPDGPARPDLQVRVLQTLPAGARAVRHGRSGQPAAPRRALLRHLEKGTPSSA